MPTRESYLDSKRMLAERPRAMPVFSTAPYNDGAPGFFIRRVDELPSIDVLTSDQLDDDWLYCEQMVIICCEMNALSAAIEFRDRMVRVEQLRVAATTVSVQA